MSRQLRIPRMMRWVDASHPRRNHVPNEKAAPSLLTIIQEAVDRLVFDSFKHTVHEVSF